MENKNTVIEFPDDLRQVFVLYTMMQFSVVEEKLAHYNNKNGTTFDVFELLEFLQKEGKKILSVPIQDEYVKIGTETAKKAEEVLGVEWKKYVSEVILMEWESEGVSSEKVKSEQAEAQQLVLIFAGNAEADFVSTEDLLQYEEVRKNLISCIGDLSNQLIIKTAEALAQFKLAKDREAAFLHLQKVIPKRLMYYVTGEFEIDNSLPEGEQQTLFCDLLEKTCRCIYYFDEPDVFIQTSAEDIQKLLVKMEELSGFFEDSGNDFHELGAFDRKMLVVRDFLVEQIFGSFESDPSPGEVEDKLKNDTLRIDWRLMVYFPSSSFSRKRLNLYPAQEKEEIEAFTTDDLPLIKGEEAVRNFLRMHSIERLTMQMISLFKECKWGVERMGITPEVETEIEALDKKRNDTFLAPPEGFDDKEWIDEIEVLVKQIFPQITDWQSFLTIEEKDRLEVFRLNSLAERKAFHKATEKAHQDQIVAKNEARENDPNEAAKLIWGRVQNSLEKNGNDVQRTVESLSHVKNPDWLRLAHKHCLTGRVLAQRRIAQINNERSNRWPSMQDLGWQQITAVVNELFSENMVTSLPKFLRLETSELQLAERLILWDRAEIRSDLPDGVYNRIVDDHLQNYERVEENFAKDMGRSGYNMGGGMDDFYESMKKEELNRVPKKIMNRRNFYNTTNAVPAWWLAPEWKKVSVLRDSVWNLIRKNRLKKGSILEGFDNIIAQYATQIKRFEAVANSWVDKLPPAQKEEYELAQEIIGKEEKGIRAIADEENFSMNEIEGLIAQLGLFHDFSENEEYSQARQVIRSLRCAVNGDLHENLELLNGEMNNIQTLRDLYQTNFIWSRAERVSHEQSRSVQVIKGSDDFLSIFDS